MATIEGVSGVGSTEPPESGGGGLPAPGAGIRGVGSTEPPESGGGGLPAPGAGTRTGVSFALTEEQKALRALAREFAEKEIRPKAADYDERSHHPADVIAKAHELGLMNIHVPEELGGPGLPAFDGMLVGEELNFGCSGIGTSIGANGLGAGPVILAGSDEQKRQWLPPLLEEPILCSFGLSEPGAGSDVAALKTTAERKGDEYVLNGSKTFITNAGHAAWTVVFAKTDPAKGHRGISAFIVPMDTPGVVMEKHLDKMGQRSTDTSAFALQDVVVPAANRIGAEGQGFKIAMTTLDFTRPGTAAGAVGVAQAAFELAVEYAKERVTFELPIAMHQGVSFMIADMATEIEAARLLVWQAAWLIDQGERATLQSSHAKRFAADTAMKVTTDAVQVFGGYGYMKEYPVEKLMRDAKLFQIYEGTSQIQRLVIAKEIFLPRA
jgi:acyl-CoA dehydrogenase